MSSNDFFEIDLCHFDVLVLDSGFLPTPSIPFFGRSDCDLYAICSSTRNEDTYKKFLQNDWQTVSSDWSLLCAISVELALKQVEINLGAIIHILDTTADQNFIRLYGECTLKYVNILDDLKMVYDLSKQGNYDGVISAGPPVSLASDCENPLPQPSPFANDG